MKFISTKTVEKNRLEAVSKFDTSLVLQVQREENEVNDEHNYNIYHFNYVVNGIGNTTGFPFRASGLNFYVKVTRADVYISAVADFYDDEDYARLEDYTCDGMLEFDVEFSDSEKIALLAYLLLKCSKNS